MKGLVVAVGSLLTIVFILNCGPKQAVVAPESKPAVPSHPDVLAAGLTAEAGDRSMVVRWRQLGTGSISGYNIFITRGPQVNVANDAGAKAAPHNTTVYPGDTNPDDSVIEYTADGLENGVKYHVTVRVVYPDQTMSKTSNEAIVVCGPRGEFTLAARYKSHADGFALASGKQVRADAADNDLYFFTKDGVDYLASPSRLNGYLRKSRFISVDHEGILDQARRKISAGQLRSQKGEERIVVKPGDWVLLLTDEGLSALIHVIALSGVNDARMMRLSYNLCPLAGEAIF
jgi:hypothetical protein